MKKINKLLLSSSIIFSLLAFTACNGAASIAAANKKVVQAFEKTATTRIDSFAFDIDLGVDLSIKEFENSVEVDSMSVEGEATLEFLVNNLWTTDIQALLAVNADVTVKESNSEDLVLDAAAYAYANEGLLYIDLTEAEDFIEGMIGEELPMSLKGKDEIPGTLAELLDFDPDAEITLPFDQEQMLSYVSAIKGVTTSVKTSETLVTYSVTLNDVASILIQAMLDSGEITSGDVSEATTEILAMLAQILEIEEAKITIGIGKDGYISKLHLDLDAALTIQTSQESSTKIDFEGHVHFDIADINKTITIAFPTDLSQYPDIPLFD